MGEGENRTPGEDLANDITKQAGKAGKNVAKKVGKQVGKVVKKAVKKAIKEAGKLIIKALVKALIAILPYLLIGLAILLVIVAGWYVLFEVRGSMQEYTFDPAGTNNNHMVTNDKNTYIQTKGNGLSDYNSQIKIFYQQESAMSYYQILGKDNTKLVQANPDKPSTVQDYYQKEDLFHLSTEFLFSLDEYMFQTKFRYPEQFIKPVDYDPKTLTLTQLADKNGVVTAMSPTYGSDGKATGKKVPSVSGYGLGSIFTYKDGQLTHTAEGYYYMEDTIDPQSGAVVQKPIHENFDDTMQGYPQKIHLMTKAITFQGEHTYSYEDQKHEYTTLKDTAGPANSSAIRVPYATATLKGGAKVTLYKYRKGAVYETVPIQTADNFHNDGNRYLEDYLYNFESYVPQDVLDGFDFSKRVSGKYINTHINVGGQKNSSKFARSMQYFPIINRYATMYGVDPYIVVALMSQESGGNSNVTDGLMQLTGTGQVISARNLDTGQMDSFTVDNTNKMEPDSAIRIGVMQLASDITYYNGDILKGLQSYNLGEGTVDWIKAHYPQDWNSLAWLSHRVEARDAVLGPSAGDPQYVEHVLQYYAGDGNYQELVKQQKENWLQKLGNIISNAISGVIDSVFHRDYSKETIYHKFDHPIGATEYQWTLQMATAMTNETLFSDSDPGTLNFWDEGFGQGLSNSGLSSSQLLDLAPNAKGFSPPLNDKNPKVTSPFGQRVNPNGGGMEFHQGIDIAEPDGTPVYAVGDGIVTVPPYDAGGYGNWVTIDHGGNLRSVYGHLSKILVKTGQVVKRGQLLGLTGHSGDATGPHLHFEIDKMENGKPVPLDPTSIAIQPGAFKN